MKKFISRTLSDRILELHKFYPVTIITGARQVGKTELCKNLFADYSYANLEEFGVRTFAQKDPNYFLDTLGEKAIIDEAQNCPELLSSIQVRVDKDKSLRYVITGSSNFSLMHSVCQSLAGRAALFNLPPFTFSELGEKYIDIDTDELIYKGFYPGAIIDDISPYDFYRNYYNTYVDRDVRNLLKVKNLDRFNVFVGLLAGRVGSEFNASSLSVEVGVSSTTIAEWLSILQAAYIVFVLRPYYSNISKRLTKMPKVYFYDTGLLTYLLGIEVSKQLATHPLRGAVFENLVVAELVKRRMNEAKELNVSFYRESSGREVDVLASATDGLRAYEIKSARTYRNELVKNLEYLQGKLGEKLVATSLIYDGETIGDKVINFRDL
jgi:predicted AAA+ superfamily ATPase